MSGQPAPPVTPGPGPQSTPSSRNNLRSNPIGSRATTPVLAPSHEDQSICRSAAEAAESLLLDHRTFPTLFIPPDSSDDLSDGERLILPVLAALVSWVHHLASEVALLKISAPLPVAHALSQTDRLTTAALRNLTSKVTSLAARPPPATLVPTGWAPPSPPPPKKKPLLILSRQGNLTVNPTGGEASTFPKKDRFPTSIRQHFVPCHPPGSTVVPSSFRPKSDSWAEVANFSKKAGKRATAAQVALALATANSKMDKPPPHFPRPKVGSMPPVTSQPPSRTH